jgi:hypothetical protein
MSDNSPPSGGPDTRPAFRGFIVAAIVVFIILFGIVRVTDTHFKRLEAAEAPAGQ